MRRAWSLACAIAIAACGGTGVTPDMNGNGSGGSSGSGGSGGGSGGTSGGGSGGTSGGGSGGSGGGSTVSIYSIDVSPDTLVENGMVTITAIVDDTISPWMISGTLSDGAGNSYGDFTPDRNDNVFTFVLAWDAVNAIAPLAGTGRNFVASFEDAHGSTASREVTVPFACMTDTSVVCGGKCVDLKSDDASCGACGHACGVVNNPALRPGSMEHCTSGECTLELDFDGPASQSCDTACTNVKMTCASEGVVSCGTNTNYTDEVGCAYYSGGGCGFWAPIGSCSSAPSMSSAPGSNCTSTTPVSLDHYYCQCR